APHRAETIPAEQLTEVVRRVCAASCHSDQRHSGELTLRAFDVRQATEKPEIAEKMIAKLRAGMMPPPGRARPAGDTLSVLASTLESIIDRAAALHPEP